VKKTSASWQLARIVILLLLTAGLISWYVVRSEAQVFQPISKLDDFLSRVLSSGSKEVDQISTQLQTSDAANTKQEVPPTPTLKPQATGQQLAPISTPIPMETKIIVRPTAKPSAPTFPYISNNDVLTALNQYRSDHRVHQLVEQHNLCEYAEKRVADLIAFGGLDHHQGFTNDFTNGERPSQLENYPGRTIGENLAYQNCKNMTTGESFIASSAPALIEWCFDSSTAGHREAQLNTKFNNACIRNQKGYFVVIFGD